MDFNKKHQRYTTPGIASEIDISMCSNINVCVCGTLVNPHTCLYIDMYVHTYMYLYIYTCIHTCLYIGRTLGSLEKRHIEISHQFSGCAHFSLGCPPPRKERKKRRKEERKVGKEEGEEGRKEGRRDKERAHDGRKGREGKGREGNLRLFVFGFHGETLCLWTGGRIGGTVISVQHAQCESSW
jgi:hypothetical protein